MALYASCAPDGLAVVEPEGRRRRSVGKSARASIISLERLVRTIVEYVTCVCDIMENVLAQIGLPDVIDPWINPHIPSGTQNVL